MRVGARGLVRLVAETEQQDIARLEPFDQLTDFVGQRDLVEEHFFHRCGVGDVAHALDGGDEFLAAEALERRRVADVDGPDDRFVDLAQIFAAHGADHHAAVDPAQELLEVVQAAVGDLGLDFLIVDQPGVEDHADVGQVVLVVFGEEVIFAAIEFAIVIFEFGAVKILAQDSIHRAEDAFQPGLVDHVVVAAFGSQHGFVDVDDGNRSAIDV